MATPDQTHPPRDFLNFYVPVDRECGLVLPGGAVITLSWIAGRGALRLSAGPNSVVLQVSVANELVLRIGGT